MSAQRLQQICTAAMAALATLMLGTSQNDVMLPTAALAAAILSLVFTDVLGWFHLHRYVAGAAGLVAALNAWSRSRGAGLEIQFISVANLLIHLQIILLFQRKVQRIYWQLLTLSLLQVVVAAALNLFFFFGPLLVLYTGLALSTMLLFFITRETGPYLGEGAWTDGTSDVVQIESLGPKTRHEKRTTARPRRDLFRASFFRYFFSLSVSTVVVSAIVFLLMPRYGDGVWQAKATVAQTGFSGSVDLEDSGSIYESPTLVMRIGFVEEATGKPYTVHIEPYFRGRVLRNYRGRGRWTRGIEDLDAKNMQMLPAADKITSVVRQTMSFEQEPGSVVFSVAPPCLTTETPRSVRLDPTTQETLYDLGTGDDPTQYTIGTLGLRNGMQSEFSPKLEDFFPYQIRGTRIRENLPTIAAAADQIVQGIPETDVVARARALEAHFTSGRYKYSLDPSPDRDLSIDPVVDFALNHRSGHCQHFASALALMLNSVNIPARVVVGYRGGIFNDVGNYYQLREMDAHAWVEAGIPADQVPTDEIMPTEGLTGDAWMRLDPTPSGELFSSGVVISPWRQKLNDTVDYMQLLWSEYVLGLNEKRQRKAIYEPIMAAFKNFGQLLFSRDAWASRWDQLQARFRGDLFSRANARDSVIAVAVLTVAFYAIRHVFRLLYRWIGGWVTKRRRLQRTKIEFYQKLERLLARAGVRREPQQTHREFALAAEAHLARSGAEAAVAEIPSHVVQLFYRVRFGHRPLDSAERERLENWLDTLAQSLLQSR